MAGGAPCLFRSAKEGGGVVARTLDAFISHSGRRGDAELCVSAALCSLLPPSALVPYCAFMHELSAFQHKAYLGSGKLDFMMGRDKDQENKGLNLVRKDYPRRIKRLIRNSGALQELGELGFRNKLIRRTRERTKRARALKRSPETRALRETRRDPDDSCDLFVFPFVRFHVGPSRSTPVNGGHLQTFKQRFFISENRLGHLL